MEATRPDNILIRLLVLFILVVLGAILYLGGSSDASVAPPPAEPSAFTQSMAVIERVEVIVLESYPMQLRLNVTGYHPDGCKFPVTVAQWREGDNVYVEIYRLMPADVMCPMVIVEYEDTIALEGGFESGAYTIDVNGYVVEVEL